MEHSTFWNTTWTRETQRGMMRELLSQEKSFGVITLNPESNCTCREKKHFSNPMKYIDVTRTTKTSFDVMLEKKRLKITGTWMERELSDAWTGFTRFVLLKETPPEGYTWSGWRLTRKQTTSRHDDVWQDVEIYARCSEKESNTKNGYRETKARQSQAIKRNIFHWTKRRRIQAHNESRS